MRVLKPRMTSTVWLLTLSMLMTATRTAKAETCEEVLEKQHRAVVQCVEVVKIKNDLINQYELSVQQRDSLLQTTRTELDNERSKNQAFYRNPFFLIGIGLLGGVLIAK